jgi:pentatricopeptide repeat protein
MPFSFDRQWAMPSADTFTIKPIREFIEPYLAASVVSIDPFARNGNLATHTNDLNPYTKAQWHMEAVAWLDLMHEQGVSPDLILFDPPYSPRQISECYAAAGKPCGMSDTQDSVLMKRCRERITRIARPGAVCLSFGWNSIGMGNAWDMERVLLVVHGGAHNDTICVAQRLNEKQPPLFPLKSAKGVV